MSKTGRIMQVGKAVVGKDFVYKDKKYRITEFPNNETVKGFCLNKDSIGQEITVKISKIKHIRPA